MGYYKRGMGRPIAKTTKYPRRKPKPGKFVRAKKSARKSNVVALQKMMSGRLKSTMLTERDHQPPSATTVRALRQLTGLTQESFASQLGTSGIVVSQWELGRRAPDPKYTAKLRALATMNQLDLDLMEDPDYYRNHLQVEIFVEKNEGEIKEKTT